MEHLIIDGIGSELQGVSRLSDGRVAFVPGAIPGEKVSVEITHEKGRFCIASLCDVLEPSEDRTAPSCPLAGVCGGCQARHMRYERTLRLKQQVVSDALQRIGGFAWPNVNETLGCVQPDRSRNKAEYPIGFQGGDPVIGAFAHGSHSIIALNDCLLQRRESVHALRWFSAHLKQFSFSKHLRTMVTRVNRAGELMLVLCADSLILEDLRRLVPMLHEAIPELRSIFLCHLSRRPKHALDGRCFHVSGTATLKEHLMSLDFEISPQSFFQVNPDQTEVLYAKALEAAGIRPGCGLNVLDAYCGTGTITLSAARWADRVTGIEIVPEAIEDADRNADENGLRERTRFLCGDAAREIPRLLNRGNRFDAVILDPPRKGADTALLDALITAGIPIISYVSCNPATLARDARHLAAGGYRLEWAQPVDMFPWTGHVETVVLMSQVGR